MTLNNNTKASVERVRNGHRRAGPDAGSGGYSIDAPALAATATEGAKVVPQ